MPEHSTPQEDVEAFMRSSYESGKPSHDELGKETRRFTVGTLVHLTEQGREWNKNFVPDSALTVVRFQEEDGVPVYTVRDENGAGFNVRDTDEGIDTSHSVDSRRAA